MNWFDRLAENVAGRIIITIVTIALGLIPTWLAWGIFAASGAVTFWETLAVVGLLFYFLIGIQFVLLVFVVILLAALWSHKS